VNSKPVPYSPNVLLSSRSKRERSVPVRSTINARHVARVSEHQNSEREDNGILIAKERKKREENALER
jgi:hypothetical protein